MNSNTIAARDVKKGTKLLIGQAVVTVTYVRKHRSYSGFLAIQYQMAETSPGYAPIGQVDARPSDALVEVK